MMLVSSINNYSKAYDNIIFNGAIYNEFVDSKESIYGNLSKENALISIIQDKATGKMEPFIRDPFYNDKKNSSYIEQIYIDDKNNKGYYLDTSETVNERGFSIVQFDFNTFHKKEIYRESFTLRKTVFLGLNQISDIKASNENDFNENRTIDFGDSNRPKFFIDKDYLYLIRENGVFKVNIKSKKQKELIKEDEIESVSYDGENIYYIDNVYDLYKYSIKTKEKIKLTTNKSRYSIIAENKIIYTNLNDNNRIYIMNKDGSDNHKIGGNKARNLNFDDKYIYYSNDDDNKCLYRIRYDGSENTKMTNAPAYFIFTFKNYDKIYIWSDDIKTNSIRSFSVDKNDFDIQLIDI